MSLQIAYITDLHLDEPFSHDNGVNPKKNWTRIIEDIGRRGINRIIFGGDIGDPQSNDWFFQAVEKYQFDISPGNHDSYNTVIKFFSPSSKARFDELCYTREEEFHKLIFLDSSKGQVSARQLGWLQEELVTKKKLLVFVHHPIISVTNTAADRSFPLAEREKVEQILLKSPTPIDLFCGHYHFNDQRVKQNITQRITMASSVQVVKEAEEVELSNETFGYRIINLDNDRVSTEIVTFNS